MKKIVIITGANKGLGKALIDLTLQDKDTVIISLSRTLNDDHNGVNKEKLILVPTDLSQQFSNDFLKIIDNIVTEECSFFVFNNAGIILPIKKIGSFSVVEVDISVAVNVSYPINLVNTLISRYSDHNMTIVNISSGAGNNPISHWSLYGASKAYMAMFFKILKEENNKRLAVYSIDPGVLDTGMQKSIRENVFPKQNDFISFKNNQILIDPANAAIEIFSKINF
nr:SDR family NAD(P)-dependent oxidoreductase [uncultured Flavobacterium sp.]